MSKQSKLGHWGWTNASHNWCGNCLGGTWLHESQSDSQHNSEDYQEDIEGWLTLTTPTDCEEDSEEYTQSSQKSFQVNVHLLSTNIILVNFTELGVTEGSELH